jgi:perosamine synthetase
MNYLDNWINQKNYYARKIISAFSNISFLSFLDTVDSKPSYYGLVMKFHNERSNGVNREEFVKALHAIGLIEVDIPNSTSPLDKLPFFNHSERSKRLSKNVHTNSVIQNYPEAYKFYNQIIKMPVWVRQEDEEIIDLYIEGFKLMADKIINNVPII